MRRGGHLFVADYGMQLNILNRYGIKNFAVPNKDYIFVNGDNTDYRYQNIKIINRYNGVTLETSTNSVQSYVAKIHVNGDYIIGRYKTDTEAAIAYNKAVDTLLSNGFTMHQKHPPANIAFFILFIFSPQNLYFYTRIISC